MAATKYPKAIGTCIDKLYTMRAERLAAQKVVDKMKKDEQDLEDHILKQFGKSELNGAKGSVATAAVKTIRTVNLTDWDQFVAWVAKTKAWDCLRRQPSVTAVKERWEAGDQVPGTEPFDKIDLSLTKV